MIGDIRDQGTTISAYDVGNAAIGLGDRRLVNSIILGAIADQLPFPAEALLEQLLKRFQRKGEAMVALNKKAFKTGREAFTT